MLYRYLLSIAFLILISNVQRNETAENPKASVHQKTLRGYQKTNSDTTKTQVVKGRINANSQRVLTKGVPSKMLKNDVNLASKTRKTDLAKNASGNARASTGSLSTFRNATTVLREDKKWYNQKNFMCTKKCWHQFELYYSQDVSREENCSNPQNGFLSNFQDKYHCLIPRLNTTRFAVVPKQKSLAVEDTRIICRPYDDPMSWYRGKQAVTIRKQSCLRWDTIKSLNFTFDDFNHFQSPSQEYSLKNSIVTVSDHHNFCRNPDNHELGPWCYVRNMKGEIFRNSCFYPCASFSNQLCLRKNHFPYRLLHRAVKYEKHFPLKLVDTISIEKHNKVIDLMDMLDVPHVLNQVSGATSAIRIGPLGIPAVRGYTRGSILSTRKRCYQSGAQTQILGPWTPVKGKLSTESLDYIMKPRDYNQYTKFALLNMHPEIGHQLWEPCFTSCEDETIQCWPKVQHKTVTAFNKAKKLEYYGRKTTTFLGTPCLAWPEVLKLVQEPHHPVAEALLRLISDRSYYLLPDTYNQFLDGQGFLLNKNYCLDFGRLLRLSDRKMKSSFYYSQIIQMISSGPGCFISNQTLMYQPCYRPCSCSLENNEWPSEVRQGLCGNETAELCIEKVEKKEEGVAATLEEYDESFVFSMGKAPRLVLMTTMIYPLFGLTVSICFCCVLRKSFKKIK